MGSTRVVTNSSGVVIEVYDYYPFGLLMLGCSTNMGYGYDLYKFTGIPIKAETSLFLNHDEIFRDFKNGIMTPLLG